MTFRWSILCIALLSVRAGAQVRLAPYPAGAAEATLADSNLLFRDAELLLKGDSGLRILIQEAEGQDATRSQAARLTLLGSSNTGVLPVLLDRIGTDTPDAPIAIKALRNHPEEAWPYLVDMAERGNSGAMAGIAMYLDRGPREIERLSYHRSPKVRANAMSYITTPEGLYKALTDPSREVRRVAVRQIITISPGDQAKYLRDSRTEIRALFAEMTRDRWSGRDFPTWIGLAGDPSAEVRRWAMLMLAPIGLDWGNGPWTSTAIASVTRGIRDADPRVRETAALAARSWLLEWRKIGTRWTSSQIQAAKAVFRTSTFREAAYQATRSEYGDDNAKIRMGILVAPGYQALAISGDPRTFAIFKSRILKDPAANSGWIAALRYVPGRPTNDLLFALLDKAIHGPRLAPNQGNGFESQQILGSALVALKGLGVPLYPRLTRYLTNVQIQPVYRLSLVGAMAPVADAKLLKSIAEFESDPSLPDWVRMQVMYDLVQCSDPGAKELMDKVSKSDSPPDVRKAANLAAQQWVARRQK